MKKIFNDNESEKDYLGYENYINAFKYIVDGEKKLIQPPIVFGIHGDWGIGKSTFMNLLSKEFEMNSKNIIIKLNPWENRKIESVSKNFFIELYKQLKEKNILEKVEGVMDKLFELIYPLKLKFGVGTANAEYDISKLKEIEKKRLLEEYIDIEYSMKDKITKLLENKVLDDYDIIVFVDDLDRCSVDKVIEVLESIKLFLNTKRCIFFIGCDIKYLSCAIANYYEKFIGKKEDDFDIYRNKLEKFTKEYLEKIIQVPFNIPSIDKTSMKNYIYGILNDKKLTERNINEIENEGIKLNNILSSEFVLELLYQREINPRRIKRIINIIYINYLFLITKCSNIEENDIKLLILLTIISDENQIYYKKKLSKSEMCKNLFKIKFLNYQDDYKCDEESSEVEISEAERVIERFFEIYFRYGEVQNETDLENKLINLDNIITVNNTTSLGVDSKIELDELEKIKSVTKTKRYLNSFLLTVKSDEGCNEFIMWFFYEIFLNRYKDGKLVLGIPNNKNVLIFKNEIIDGNFEECYLMKLTYDEINKKIKIIFDTTKYTSKFKKKKEESMIYEVKDKDNIKKYIKELYEGEI